MKYRLKPLIVDATQWFKNGDHPMDYANEKVGLENGEIRTWTGAEVKANGWEGQVVRYFRDPSVDGGRSCHVCDRMVDDHGWIDHGPDGKIVCPGDWVITGPNQSGYDVMDSELFEKVYERVEELEDSSIRG